jgi:hypothetical protein
MFGANWNDPQTMWLNWINLSLGLVTLVCFAAIGYGLLQDLRARARKPAREQSAKSALQDLARSFDGHSFDMPGLGLTMADGGEPLDRPGANPKAPGKKKGR